ncbi:MAG: hypothetical protein ACFCUT_00200 [Kiloniellaceae bacterium]
MRIRRIVKWVGSVVVVLVLVVAVAGFFLVRALVEPDADMFGKVQDEATQAGLARADFVAASEPYFVEMDKGVLLPPQGGVYPPEIAELAAATGLDPEAVRRHAIRGQNTWLVWSGGNDRFWDFITTRTAGAFDLLKVVSSHPSQYHGRENRSHYLGLVNEPCFAAPIGPDPDRFGLWLDRRSPECLPDPFADAEKYPGVEIGARGSTVPVGSYYGEPSGIVGLRLFPNPAFDEEAAAIWDPVRYYEDSEYYHRKDIVRPYRVGMTCAFCHVGPSPVQPPADPENPTWSELNSNPGAQYFWVDRIFVWDTGPREEPGKPAPHERNFIFQIFHTNPPGSLDTSLVSTDYMNNPRTMNGVYNVGARLQPTLRWGREQLAGGSLHNKQFQDYDQTAAFSGFWNNQSGEIDTARVLKDGADSVGILGALNRVYLNIGTFSEEWLLHFRPIIGGQKISPIRIADANANSAYWGATEDQTADMAIFFLVSATPDDLADAPGGEAYLEADAPEKVARGKLVFAENCAGCHSSKIPSAPAGSGIDEGICAHGGNGPNYRECWDRYWSWVQSDDFKAAMAEIVLAEDFLDDNFLSTERRVPLDLLGTNACSPLASNALRGDIWDDFSSESYKTLPPVKELTVHHPVSGGAMSLKPQGSGRGYSRPASLVSLWTSAPYLQNNSVGFVDYPYTSSGYATGGYRSGGSGGYANRCPAASDADPYLPCVDNRMRLFDDSIRKLLWPELRRQDERTSVPVPGYIYRTTAASCLKVPAGYLPPLVRNNPAIFHWLAPWAFKEDGSLAVGPFPEGFPINTVTNIEVLPDNDEPMGMSHAWRLAKAGPTLLRTFKALGGACTDAELASTGTQARAEQVIRDNGLIDALIGLSKCPDYVVNRGHTFGAGLADDDKEALIAFLKRL